MVFVASRKDIMDIIYYSCLFAGVIRYFTPRKKLPHVIIALSWYIVFMLTSLVIGLSISARYRMPVNLFIFRLPRI